jgi:hypothetical protein
MLADLIDGQMKIFCSIVLVLVSGYCIAADPTWNPAPGEGEIRKAPPALMFKEGSLPPKGERFLATFRPCRQSDNLVVMLQCS